MDQPKLYDRVALTRDIDEHGLKRGDVVTWVDTVPHPSGGSEGMVIEVTNAIGQSIKVVVIHEGDIEPLQANEIFSVRPLAHAI